MSGYAILIDGEVVGATLLEWARWFDDDDKRRVAKTMIGEVMVSTVFLGLDHRFGEGRPLWFETMVFGGEHDDELERYTTVEESRLGHERWVDKVRA